MAADKLDEKAVVKILNEIMEAELAGVVRYTHYALMVYGHNRIPIVSWLREQATTSLAHANQAGELVTHIGQHPSLKIGALLDTRRRAASPIRALMTGSESSVTIAPASASGSRAGTSRPVSPSTIASAAGSPCRRSVSSAKSTIMMPFFLTSPTSMMIPTKA